VSDQIKIAMIVARGRNGVIGRDGDLPWRLSADLKNFKKVTLGKPIIMGRKTWESFPKRPLPGRANIVLSRDWNYAAPGGRVYSSLTPALGGAIYSAALPLADRLYLTEVDAAPDGETVFPDLDMSQWREASREDYGADEKNNHAFAVLQLDRVIG